MATKDLILKNRPLPFVVGIALVAASAFAAMAEPVELRMGAGPSSEEQVWLMKARPDLTPNQGKIYKYTMSIFRSGERKNGRASGRPVGCHHGEFDRRAVCRLEGRAARRSGRHGEGKHQDILDIVSGADRIRTSR